MIRRAPHGLAALGLAAVASIGCGRLDFEPRMTDAGLPENGEVVTGQIVAAARSDGSAFATAWLAHQADGARVWKFGGVEPSGQWTTAPTTVFADRDLPLTSVELHPLGDRWLLLRQYEWAEVRMPIDLAIITSDGVVTWQQEDDFTWFAAARVVTSSAGFGVFYHHHERQSDMANRRQVFSRHYDLTGQAITGERDVVEVLDDQFLVATTPTPDGTLVTWREETSGTARLAIVSPAGGVLTSATITGIGSAFWRPSVVVTSGGAVFAESTDAGLRLRRVDATGSPVWSPQEQEVSLGDNRFQFRSTALAGDLATTFVMWLRDDLSDLPIMSVAELVTSGASPIVRELPALTDGSTADSAPALALSPSSMFAAWVREADGRREVQVRVLPR